jgi:hypothetical protein
MASMRLALALAGLFASASAAAVHERGTPMERVVQLLAGIKARVEADGKAEQKSYDKYACWCEDTLGRKASDITDAKSSIEDLGKTIEKTKAELASNTANVGQLKKQIAGNIASEREASEVRNKEHGEYSEDKSESENCIGALEAAIKVLAGAGGKKSFLGTLQEAQILGVVAGIKGVLKTSKVTQRFSDDQIAAVEKFAEKPEDYVGGHTMGFSAAQVANNPFGDYAPQSTQIQGILKGMYDTFTGDLEKDNAAEAERQKAFEALLATKKAELATLEATLERTELDAAGATKLLADSKETRDDTKEQLEADESFFASSKATCQTKAAQWAQRTRLRVEELSGMNQAIAIMSSDEAKATFKNATTTFLQLRSIENADDNSDRMQAYHKVKELATELKSLSLARIAVAIRSSTVSTGHFDKVITMIDTMIGMMRKEEAEDIQHRDRCETKQNANQNAQDDISSGITKVKASLLRMGNTEGELKANLKTIQDEIAATKKAMDELLEMRNKESGEFTQALKDDANAIQLISEAIAVLSKFYTDNKAALLQAPEYAENADKPPETFADGNYGGRKSETGGVVAILGMLKDDLEKEMASGKADDASGQNAFEKDNSALEATLEAQKKKESDIESASAALGAKMEDVEEDQSNNEGDLAAEKKIESSLATDCAWVKSTFKTRREKRKLEMDGLVEAKDFLAGVDSGAAVLAPISGP